MASSNSFTPEQLEVIRRWQQVQAQEAREQAAAQGGASSAAPMETDDEAIVNEEAERLAHLSLQRKYAGAVVHQEFAEIAVEYTEPPGSAGSQVPPPPPRNPHSDWQAWWEGRKLAYQKELEMRRLQPQENS